MEVDRRVTPDIGTRVIWLGLSGGRSALVKWTGILPEISGEETALGIAFDSALDFGGGGGIWKGRRLFSCEPGCGLFVPASSVIAESYLRPHHNKQHAVHKNNTSGQHSTCSAQAASSNNPKVFFELFHSLTKKNCYPYRSILY